MNKLYFLLAQFKISIIYKVPSLKFIIKVAKYSQVSKLLVDAHNTFHSL